MDFENKEQKLRFELLEKGTMMQLLKTRLKLVARFVMS